MWYAYFKLFLSFLIAIKGNPVIEGWTVPVRGIYPFVVRINIFEITLKYNETSTHQVTYGCGGVILTNDVVLSAGHCIGESLTKVKIRIWAGIIDLNDRQTAASAQVSDAKDYLIHPNFTKSNINLESNDIKDYNPNDIVLIWLKNKFTFNNYVRPAVLNNGQLPLNNRYGRILGWGRVGIDKFTNLLQQGIMKVMRSEDCNRHYNNTFTDKTICVRATNNQTTGCVGDSGGPFVIRQTVIGIFSWITVQNYAYENGTVTFKCIPDHPTLFTSVATFSDWINENIKNGPAIRSLK